MKIYTKTGDKGTTALFGGKRVSKNHLRIESYGTIDELNSYIGLIRDQNVDRLSRTSLIKIQNELFTIGAMLATPPEKKILKNGKERLNIAKLNNQSIQYLEDEIDRMSASLPRMTHFILPGGHQTVSFCHVARCVCRRAERLAVTLHTRESASSFILIYLNRLSDYLFVLARKSSETLKADEIKWIPEKL